MILAVLELPRGEYRYEEVFRYLKTGFAGLTWEQCDTLETMFWPMESRAGIGRQGLPGVRKGSA